MKLYRITSLASILISMALFQTGLAFGHQPLRIKGADPLAPSRAAGKVLYFGGPVLSNAKIYTVFWGARVDPAIQSMIIPFYQTLATSSYLDQLSEYNTNVLSVAGNEGTHQSIGKGSYAGTVTIVPKNTSASLTQSDIEKELDYQMDQGVIPTPDSNSLYMIHYPSTISISISFGVSCQSWFADHEVYQSSKHGPIVYAMMPCGNSADSFSSLTVAASHEIAESITDPFSPLANQTATYPAAWLAADQNEIGDLCAWQNAKLTSGTTIYSVQQEWSNAQNGCVATNYQ